MCEQINVLTKWCDRTRSHHSITLYNRTKTKNVTCEKIHPKRQLHHRLEVEPDFDSYTNESCTKSQKNDLSLTTTVTTTHSISNLMIIFYIAAPTASSFFVLNVVSVFLLFSSLVNRVNDHFSIFFQAS